MGLITKIVEIKLGGGNDKYYEALGYKIPRVLDKWHKNRLSVKRGTKLKVFTKDLLPKSKVRVKLECDECGRELEWEWRDYTNQVKEDNKTYCLKCSHKLFGKEKEKQTKLKNSKSFYDWCYENLDKTEADEILNRWDYELNKCSPKNICYSSTGFNHKGYWFKCLEHLEHKSELHSINSFTNKIIKDGKTNILECKQCNSIAQYLIDTYGENALGMYWDYDKNKDVNPWEISRRTDKTKLWIRCTNKDYHGSYEVIPAELSIGRRCPYCSHNGAKIHPNDSLGKILQDKNLLYIWSEKNTKSPFKIAPHSQKKMWWKCPDGKHEDFYRDIASSNNYDFRCPKCEGYSKGEEKTDNYLVKNKIINEPQKTFEGLLGLGKGLLSYDFYLPTYNLLIEIQGEQHEKPIDFKGKGLKYAKEQFNIQKIHDKRKREYAKEHNIKLLEIWYNCFDDIEFIMDNVLKELKNKQYNNYISNKFIEESAC